LRAGRLAGHATLPDLGRGQLGLLDGPLGGAPRDVFYDPDIDGDESRATVVLLAEVGADPRLSVVEALVRDRTIPLTMVTAEQPEPLARAAFLIALADFAAAYLAILTGIGPDQGRTIEEYRLRTAQ
jgi:hypothetical protein